jgi:hypothetical protein
VINEGNGRKQRAMPLAFSQVKRRDAPSPETAPLIIASSQAWFTRSSGDPYEDVPAIQTSRYGGWRVSTCGRVPSDANRISRGSRLEGGGRQHAAQSVSKLQIPRFSTVTLPLPEGYQANTERSDESSFPITGRGARFDTLWTLNCPS